MGRREGLSTSVYDAIAEELTTRASAERDEDVPFYVAEARKAGGPVVELGVGTGRIAVPTALAGVSVIGVDSSVGMLDVCRRRAAVVSPSCSTSAWATSPDPPVSERVSLVTCPFRSYLRTERRPGCPPSRAPTTCSSLGAASSSTSSPRTGTTSKTHGRAGSRGQASSSGRTGIRRSARCSSPCASRQVDDAARLDQRRRVAPGARGGGLRGRAVYGWFDYRPFTRQEDMIFVCAALVRFAESLDFQRPYGAGQRFAARRQRLRADSSQLAVVGGAGLFGGDELEQLYLVVRMRLRRSGRGPACRACRRAPVGARGGFRPSASMGRRPS